MPPSPVRLTHYCILLLGRHRHAEPTSGQQGKPGVSTDGGKCHAQIQELYSWAWAPVSGSSAEPFLLCWKQDTIRGLKTGQAVSSAPGASISIFPFLSSGSWLSKAIVSFVPLFKNQQGVGGFIQKIRAYTVWQAVLGKNHTLHEFYGSRRPKSFCPSKQPGLWTYTCICQFLTSQEFLYQICFNANLIQTNPIMTTLDAHNPLPHFHINFLLGPPTL